MATMALDIPVHEGEEVALLLTVKWTTLGRVSIGCLLLASNQIKLAVRVANKSDITMVTANTLAMYTLCHGIEFDHCLVAVSMVVPGTWMLTLKDSDLANWLCSLYKVVLFGKELSISPWKESFRQAEHWAYVSGITETTSRRGVIKFFCLRCGEVTDHHFRKLPDGRMALWVTIQFKMANGLAKALQFDSTLPPPPLSAPRDHPHSCPHTDCKRFNGKCVSVTKARTKEECEVDLKCQVSSETRQAAKAAAQQACQQCQAAKRASNTAAMAEYMQNALLLAQNFPRCA